MEEIQIEKTELKKPKMRLWPQQSLTQKVSGMVERVENPEDAAARATFGRHQTEAEKRAQTVRRTLLELVIWVTALLIIVGLVSANWEAIKNFLDLVTGNSDPVVVEEPAPTPVASRVKNSIFSGLAYQLGEDLGWIRSEFFSNLTYYAAGEVTTGEYAGAKRYFAVGLLISDSTLSTYELWQLSDGQVLLNGEKQNSRRFLQILNDYYVRMFFADNVTMIDQLSGDWQETIPVSASMLLYRREVLTDLGPYDGVNRGSPRLALTLPSTYYQQLPMLEAKDYVDLKFYTKMYSGDELFSQIAPNLASRDEWIADRYLFGGTKIIVTDKTGVSYTYELVMKDTWDNYKVTRDSDLRYLEYYKQELIKYTATANFAEYKAKALAGQIVALPDGQPRMPVINDGLPGINFVAGDFEFTAVSPQFDEYTSAYTAVCYPRIDAKILQNITADDLVQVGRLFAGQWPVYVLKDQEHVLYKLAYDLKMVDNTIPESTLRATYVQRYIEMEHLSEDLARDILRGDKQITMPELIEYAQAAPLLIIPDPWGRYMLVWENDLDFLVDCGIIHDQ